MTGWPQRGQTFKPDANYIRHITDGGPVRSRSVGLITGDAALYAELASVLRERRIPTVSLLPGERIPDRVAVVLTSHEESARIPHPCVLIVAPGADRSTLFAAVEHALDPDAEGRAGELVVGLDPGPRPGYAVVAGGRILAEGVLEAPEAAGPWGEALAGRFPGRAIRFRVGMGDPPARNRIVRSLAAGERTVELVDEHRTTPRVARRHRDAAAARAIARTPGRAPRAIPELRPTMGALTRIQHLSREGSGGRFSISRAVAGRVLRGELTLAEALDAGRARYAGAPRGDGLGTPPENPEMAESVRRAWPPPSPT